MALDSTPSQFTMNNSRTALFPAPSAPRRRSPLARRGAIGLLALLLGSVNVFAAAPQSLAPTDVESDHAANNSAASRPFAIANEPSVVENTLIAVPVGEVDATRIDRAAGLQLNAPIRGVEAAQAKPQIGPLFVNGPVVQVAAAKATDEIVPEVQKEKLEEKREEIATELRIAMSQEKVEASAVDSQSDEPTADASRVDLLKQIDVVLAQQKSATSSNEDHDAKVAALRTSLGRLESGTLPGGPPFSIVMLDQFKEAVVNDKTRLESAEASVIEARSAADTAKLNVDERAKQLRQIKESIGAGDELVISIAELEKKLAEEMLVLRRQEMSIEKANLEIAKLQLQIDQRKVGIVGQQVVFTKEALDEILEEFENRESSLKRKTKQLRSDLQFAERRWMAASQEADSLPVATVEASERVDSLKISQMTLDNELSLINQRLQRIPILKKAWERRFFIIQGEVARKDRRNWAGETLAQIEQVVQDRRTRQLKMDELRVAIAEVETRLEGVADDKPEMRRWLDVKRSSYRKQAEVFGSSLSALDSAERTLQQLSIQIDGEPGRSVAEMIEDSWETTIRVWHYELAEFEETSVTVGKVCSSVLLLFIGFLLARWISGWLGNRLQKWGVDEAGSHAIESLSFYALLITLGLTTLRYANVPLTVFTFLGGAVAIGLGFGSQNILNNFISGLILLAERPIKVGDLIKIDDTYGNVAKIGARSTMIRTGENLDIVVPNSKFLENDVTNLTRRDNKLRTSISVGVAYGSDLQAVLRLLARAAAECDGVLQKPKPMVWFNDFADSALVFQVHFWIHAKTVTDIRLIETAVRLNIDTFFKESDVVIAFPQQDLHLQSASPIDFRLVGPDNAMGPLTDAA